jgi:hypothetical protein
MWLRTTNGAGLSVGLAAQRCLTNLTTTIPTTTDKPDPNNTEYDQVVVLAIRSSDDDDGNDDNGVDEAGFPCYYHYQSPEEKMTWRGWCWTRTTSFTTALI